MLAYYFRSHPRHPSGLNQAMVNNPTTSFKYGDRAYVFEHIYNCHKQRLVVTYKPPQTPNAS